MLDRGHNCLLMHLIATFEQFNAYEDVTTRQTASQTIHAVVAQGLKHSIRIGIFCVIIYEIDSIQQHRQPDKQ
jgi:hypothetical protein